MANVYLHYALDLWFEKVVQPRCRGEVYLCRYADDFVCAFRFKEDAEKFYNVLPQRLAKFTLEVAPEKTRILPFSRFHTGLKHRFTFLGFEFYWKRDRKGLPRVTRRTCRKKLQGACRKMKTWIKENRHESGDSFFKGLNARLRGHYTHYGVIGNLESVNRFYEWAKSCTYKWLNRRGGKRRSFTWEQFNRILRCVPVVRPRITEVNRTSVYA